MAGARQASTSAPRMPGIGQEPRLVPVEAHACSFCGKTFPTLQALGGHQTGHRREIEQMRHNHETIMGGAGLELGTPRKREAALDDPYVFEPKRPRVGIEVVPFVMFFLPPNPKFWEEYHRTGRRPPVIDYIGEQSKLGGKVWPDALLIEKPVADPRKGKRKMEINEEEAGEEVSSVNLEMGLKY